MNLDLDPTPPADVSPGAPGLPEPSSPKVASLALPHVGAEQFGGDAPANLHVLRHVELDVSVELGRRRLPLADVLRLGAGSVVELEKLVGEPLEVYANGRLIAEGEAVVVDEQFGVRILRLVGTAEAA